MRALRYLRIDNLEDLRGARLHYQAADNHFVDHPVHLPCTFDANNTREM